MTVIADIPEALLDVYSDDIIREAFPRVTFMEFAIIRDDLMISKGETLVFTKYADLGGDPEILETATPVDDTLSAGQISLKVTEYIKSAAVSEKLASLSWDDVLGEAAIQLGRHYTLWGPDNLLKQTAQLGAATTLYGGGAASRAAVQPTGVFDVALVRAGALALQNKNVPKFHRAGDAFYVCVCHPKQLSNLRQDADWEEAHKYVDPSNIYNGEAGRFEGVVFISTTQVYNGKEADATDPIFGPTYLDDGNGQNALSVAATPANLAELYMATMFGDSYYALGRQKPVEVRQKVVAGYGRTHGLAWYAIYGAAILNPTHGVSIETA